MSIKVRKEYEVTEDGKYVYFVSFSCRVIHGTHQPVQQDLVGYRTLMVDRPIRNAEDIKYLVTELEKDLKFDYLNVYNLALRNFFQIEAVRDDLN